MAASDCLQNKFSEYPCDMILGISVIVCSVPQHFSWFENYTVLILKLNSGISFTCNKKSVL